MNLLYRVSAFLHRYFMLSPLFQRVVPAFVITVTVILLAAALLKKLRWKKAICMSMLINYLFLVYISTVLTRIPYWGLMEAIRSKHYIYNLVPFHSYIKILQGNKTYILEVIFNFFMLFPAGVLLPMAQEKTTWKRTVIFACIITLSIELAQLFFKCGTFETDDLFHNVAGCLVGYFVYQALSKNIKKMRTK